MILSVAGHGDSAEATAFRPAVAELEIVSLIAGIFARKGAGVRRRGPNQ